MRLAGYNSILGHQPREINRREERKQRGDKDRSILGHQPREIKEARWNEVWRIFRQSPAERGVGLGRIYLLGWSLPRVAADFDSTIDHKKRGVGEGARFE